MKQDETQQGRIAVYVREHCDLVVEGNEFPPDTPPSRDPAGELTEAEIMPYDGRD